eukprot:COSAG02_NODE_24899_length_674_cov_1.542609_1_plen_89_part_10
MLQYPFLNSILCAILQNVRTSGDGTVPYQSLRFSQTWDSPQFLSQCIELTGKEHEHRAILSSKQFHRIVTVANVESFAFLKTDGQSLDE